MANCDRGGALRARAGHARCLSHRPARTDRLHPSRTGRVAIRFFPLFLGALGPRAIAEYYSRRDLEMSAEGLERLPGSGPAIVAARHYHHLYDGAALVMQLPRRLHIFVALDWARTPKERRAMELVCSAARWPVVLRPKRFIAGEAAGSAYSAEEITRYLRQSLADAAELLREGRVVVVFPEGFPAIEPMGVRTRSDDAMLPFEAGFTSIAMLAQRGGAAPVPIIPAGLEYNTAGRKQHVTVRLGEPLFMDGSLPRDAVVRAVQSEVARLSGLHPGPAERGVPVER